MSSPAAAASGDTPQPDTTSNTASSSTAAAPRAKPGKQARGKHSGRCAHLAGKTKAVIDRLKVLVPYANVCKHRQALLQGRRGGSAAAAAAAAASVAGDREGTPAAGEGDRSRKRLVDEMPAPTCLACHTPGDRLHACLACDHYGCWRRGGGGGTHMQQHLRASGHAFALDFSRLVVYCAQCGDYVHDAAVDAWLLGAQMRWHAALCDAAEPEAKRPRIVSTAGDLSPAQAKYLREHGALQPCGGVRGLRNLGATCYLSVVLQALAHNPLVRGWMLSDGHHPAACRRAPCMACELDAAFQALFARGSGSGAAAPFAPTRLLRALWLLRGDLAGYGQQDAHECLMALLDTLHTGLAGAAPQRPCPCAVHQTFAGLLQSTVTCGRCGNTTQSHDPMLDVSLDIPAPRGLRALDAAAAGHVTSLHDCLAHFTRAEALAGYACGRCGVPGAAVKQLSIKELPPVLALQLKRFRHGARRGAKEDAYVRLPEHIDMTPYTAAALASRSQTVAGLRASLGHAVSSTGGVLPASVGGVAVHDRNAPGADPAAAAAAAAAAAVPRDTPLPVLSGPGGSSTLGKRRTDARHSNPACQYVLFAVVEHVGRLDTGHYTAYARQRAQWYRFDDAHVAPADIRDVLALAEEAKAREGRGAAVGRAYMAFYHKAVLDYHDGTGAAEGAGQMGVANTHVDADGEFVEDAGTVRTRTSASGDVRVERRGRKKGSAKPRAPRQQPQAQQPQPRAKPRATDDNYDAAEEGEIDEFIAAGSVNPANPANPAKPPQPLDSESDSDGEALWNRINRAARAPDLVPMGQVEAVRADRPLFVDPAATLDQQQQLLLVPLPPPLLPAAPAPHKTLSSLDSNDDDASDSN
ncbi:hypothetical protein LPJ53_004756 [Coemansia erecta]|uniref:Ubiquitin carboxyl-terminal hydrolase n=1 Tax=Coemansia erecta TaxID=147472 RepID=A0A9W8CRA0_9FUNG|nr:hypothetical protein LPJ53_004756 [Coemansia erecta]